MGQTLNVRIALCYHPLPVTGNIYFWLSMMGWNLRHELHKTELNRYYLQAFKWCGQG